MASISVIADIRHCGCRPLGVYVPGPRAMEGTNPVNKKLAAALSGGAVLVLALSGCSSDDGDNKLNAWAKQVCDQVQPQMQEDRGGQRRDPAADRRRTARPADVQKTDSQAFQDIVRRVQGARAPPCTRPARRRVDDGEKKQKDAVKELNDTSDGLRRPEEAGRRARHQGPGEVRRRAAGRRRRAGQARARAATTR